LGRALVPDKDVAMSLLDGLLRDALLETVMKQNIHVAIRNDAAAGAPQPIGRGTAEDPYGGRADEATWFDALMADPVRVPPNSTVLLGPGSFGTKGNNNIGNG